MAQTQALLMEIHYPDGSDSLYLMTGQGFEMLREDTGGREIYGLRHNEREYLFFPFSFKPVDAGVLSVHMPPEYEESCLDSRADGARIVFGSVHGVPFFPEMPDEYKSSSGRIRIDASGRVRIHLDKLDPEHAVFSEIDGTCCHGHSDSHGQQNDGHHDHCGCGHGSPLSDRHKNRTAPGCGCENGTMTDEALARNIRHAADALNEALRLGVRSGLAIRIGTLSECGKEDSEKLPQVHILQIARPL